MFSLHLSADARSGIRLQARTLVQALFSYTELQEQTWINGTPVSTTVVIVRPFG
jgi:hypothetical protein